MLQHTPRVPGPGTQGATKAPQNLRSRPPEPVEAEHGALAVREAARAAFERQCNSKASLVGQALQVAEGTIAKTLKCWCEREDVCSISIGDSIPDFC